MRIFFSDGALIKDRDFFVLLVSFNNKNNISSKTACVLGLYAILEVVAKENITHLLKQSLMCIEETG